MFARAPLALRSRSALTAKLSLVIIILFAAAAMAQLPTITVASDIKPTSRAGSGCGGNTGGGFPGMGGGFSSQIQDYVPLTKFEISDAGDFNKSNIATTADSIRVRGNSTASMNYPKTPYRIKFKNKTSLLGMNSSKSWVLLAQWEDGTGIVNPLAFKLSEMFEIAGTREYRHVKLKYGNDDLGVYLLIPQIQGNGDGMTGLGLDVKAKSGGWLAEFDLWSGSDAEDCKRYFKTDPWNINTKVREPELENLTPAFDTTDANFRQVKTDINELMSKMNSSGFPTNGYRDLLDIHSWAKYVLIQKFMDNYDFITEHANPIQQGSNFLHKIESGKKIKAGPIWDFDGAAGRMSTSGQQPNPKSDRYNNYTWRTGRPNHNFYGKLWDDNTGFLPCYVKAWNDKIGDIEKLAHKDGFIDSLAKKIKPSIAGNLADDYPTGQKPNCNVTMWDNCQEPSPATEQIYDELVERLKGWWKNRVDHFGKNLPNVNPELCPTDNDGSVQVTLTVTRDPQEGGDVIVKVGNNDEKTNPDPETFVSNTSITITAVPKNGWKFKEWSGDNLPGKIEEQKTNPTPQSWTNANTRTITAVFEPASSVRSQSGLFANGRSIMIMNNAVNLNVNKSATIRIVNLNGREVRKAKLTSGNHSIRLSDLPKGLYLINATVDGKKHTLRAPVK